MNLLTINHQAEKIPKNIAFDVLENSRPASLQDAEDIATLYEAGGGRKPRSEIVAAVTNLKADEKYLVVRDRAQREIGGRDPIIGMLRLARDAVDPHVATLESGIAVHASAGGAIGLAGLRRAVELARRSGYTAVRLQTDARSSPAAARIGFRIGFRPVASAHSDRPSAETGLITHELILSWPDPIEILPAPLNFRSPDAREMLMLFAQREQPSHIRPTLKGREGTERYILFRDYPIKSGVRAPIIGAAIVSALERSEEPGRPALFSSLEVDPSHEKKGVGAKILAEAQKLAWNLGFSTMLLETGDETDHRAFPMYRNAGFVPDPELTATGTKIWRLRQAF